MVPRTRTVTLPPTQMSRPSSVISTRPARPTCRPCPAIGTVAESRSEKFKVGDTVRHFAGWRTRAVLGEDEAEHIDTDAAPAEAYLGILGVTGLTAYAGLTAVGEMQEGDVVFISGAAGAVPGDSRGDCASGSPRHESGGACQSTRRAHSVRCRHPHHPVGRHLLGKLSDHARAVAGEDALTAVASEKHRALCIHRDDLRAVAVLADVLQAVAHCAGGTHRHGEHFERAPELLHNLAHRALIMRVKRRTVGVLV